MLGVGGGVADDGAEGGRGGEGALGVLGRGEVVAVVGDEELEAELVCRGGQGGAPPHLTHLTTERREIGLRPLARARQRRSGCAAVSFLSNDLHDEVDRECDTDVSERHLCQRRSRQ